MEFLTVSVSVCAALMLLRSDIKIIVPFSISFMTACLGYYLYLYYKKSQTQIKLNKYGFKILSAFICSFAAVLFFILTAGVSEFFKTIAPFPDILPVFFVIISFACGLTGKKGLSRISILVFSAGLAGTAVMLAYKLAAGIPAGVVMLNSNIYKHSIIYILPGGAAFFSAALASAAAKPQKSIFCILKLILGVAGGGALWILFRISRADAVFMISSVIICGGVLFACMIWFVRAIGKK